MTTRQRPPSHLPRWPVQVALAAVVLGVHLVLLAGGLSPRLPGAEVGSDLASAPEHPAPTGPHRSARDATPSSRPVQVSTVRWIVPTPPPAPLGAPAPTRRTVKRASAVASTDSGTGTPPEAAPVPEVVASSVAVPQVDESPVDLTASAGPAAPDETLVAAATMTDVRAARVELPPAQPPPSTRLRYDVSGSIKGIGYRAQGTLDWALANGRYDARMEMRVLLLGSRSQTSTGRIGPAGLMPERFADRSRSEKAAHFDAEHQRIRFSNNAPDVPLQPGAQDRLSLFMQLAALLQARPEAYAAGQTVDMQVAGTGDAPIWHFQVGEESTLRLPAGEVRARQLVRLPRKEFDSKVEIWLAPSLDHLPVRLRITQPNGDVADQQLSQMP